MKLFKIWLFLSTFFLMAFPSFSQEKKESLTFKADEALFTKKGRESYITLKGKAEVQEENYTIRANILILSGKDNNQVEARGDVTLINQKETLAIQGQSLFYARLQELLRVVGQAELVDTQDSLRLSAMQIVVFQEGSLVRAEGAVRFTKPGIYAEAEVLRYDRELNTLDLVGSARLQRAEERLEARRIWINLNNDQIIMEDGISGNVYLKSAQNEEKKESKWQDTHP